MKNRIEFVYFFDCKDGNPNGDPDASNAPRIDPVDMHGLVSDVCLKRKIRNFVQLTKPEESRNGIFVRQGVTLNAQIQQMHNDLSHHIDRKKGASLEQIGRARSAMCDRYFDVRAFGAVMSTGPNAGQVRGPVQLCFSRSVEPVAPLELTITRSTVTDVRSLTSGPGTKGRKFVIPYALYRCHGFVSAYLARETGFSDADLNLLWQSLLGMFDHDRSASHGTMSPQKLIVFKHDSPLGSAPAHKLFERVAVKRKQAVLTARDFQDYDIFVDRNNWPNGVEIQVQL